MSPWTVGCPTLTAAAVGDDSSSEQESEGGRGFVPWPRGDLSGAGRDGSLVGISGEFGCIFGVTLCIIAPQRRRVRRDHL